MGSTPGPVSAKSSHASLIRRLNETWNVVSDTLGKMNQAATVWPRDGNDVFVLDPDSADGEIEYKVNQVRLFLPEKASRPRPSIHVTIDGWLKFDANAPSKAPRTTSFGTRIGYFRQKGPTFEHVYGSHYDMDELSIGHPVFHSQMKAMMGHASQIPTCEPAQVVDHVTSILSNVRVPTAQMDLFSAIEKVCADHLLWENSGDVEKAAFKRLQEKSGFFSGAGHRVARLSSPEVAACYRSRHWY